MGCKGFQMAKLPEHCSGKLSQLLNALALARAWGGSTGQRLKVLKARGHGAETSDMTRQVHVPCYPPIYL
jgi:hypothetical protein